MMEILLAQSTQATVKRMQSHPSGLTLVSTGLRRHVGNELVERDALSRYSRVRALVRNRIGEDPTFNSRFARRRPPQCGWNGSEVRVPLGVHGGELVSVTFPAGRVEEGARRTDF
jgi:hypothetical protein